MRIEKMKRNDFYKLPFREDWGKPIRCKSIVILPTKKDWLGDIKYRIKLLIARLFGLDEPPIYEIGHMHDSGYRCIEVVAVDEKNRPICRVTGCSDAIHLDGIGGLGKDWITKYGRVPDLVPPSGWTIDCLPKSGLVRLFPQHGYIEIGPATSSLEVFVVHKQEVAT